MEDSLERSFRPAIAAVISFIDPQNNLRLLSSEPAVFEMWIKVFAQADKLGLNFDRLTKVVQGTATSVSKM